MTVTILLAAIVVSCVHTNKLLVTSQASSTSGQNSEEINVVETVSSTPLLSSSTASTEKKKKEFTCPSNNEDLRRSMVDCMKKGERFLTKYFRKFNRRSFSKCSESKEFRRCVNTLVNRCPNTGSQLPHEWRSIVDLMNCACNSSYTQQDKCQSSLKCMEQEMNSVYMKICGTMYEQDVKQKTKDECHFLTNYVQCSERIMTTGCGLQAGDMLYVAHKVVAWNKYKCDVRKWADYDGFEYSSKCPKNFTSILNQCMNDSLSAKVLTFSNENNLIPDESESDIKLACAAYKNYRSCLDVQRNLCPKGVSTALGQENELRTYLMKMEYICDTTQQEFSKHVPCYKQTLNSGLLQQCFKHYSKMTQLLKDTTEFQFYCKPKSKNAAALAKARERLKNCYINIFTLQCDTQHNIDSDSPQSAGALMGGLITEAFKDPIYVGFSYKPNCDLHTMDSLSLRVHSSNSAHKHRHHHEQNTRHKTKLKEIDTGHDVKTGMSQQNSAASSNTLFSTTSCYTVPKSILFTSTFAALIHAAIVSH